MLVAKKKKEKAEVTNSAGNEKPGKEKERNFLKGPRRANDLTHGRSEKDLGNTGEIDEGGKKKKGLGQPCPEQKTAKKHPDQTPGATKSSKPNVHTRSGGRGKTKERECTGGRPTCSRSQQRVEENVKKKKKKGGRDPQGGKIRAAQKNSKNQSTAHMVRGEAGNEESKGAHKRGTSKARGIECAPGRKNGGDLRERRKPGRREENRPKGTEEEPYGGGGKRQRNMPTALR